MKFSKVDFQVLLDSNKWVSLIEMTDVSDQSIEFKLNELRRTFKGARAIDINSKSLISLSN